MLHILLIVVFFRISQIRLEILKSFYEILGSEKQQDSFVETEAEIETGNNRLFLAEIEVPEMQNDDLAEADQSHLEVELDEQEGAVGGILDGNVQVMCHICKCLILF